MLEKIKIPNEILVRFDELGNVKGCHIKFLEKTVFEGEILNYKELPAEAFTLSQEVIDWIKGTINPVQE